MTWTFCAAQFPAEISFNYLVGVAVRVHCAVVRCKQIVNSSFFKKCRIVLKICRVGQKVVLVVELRRVQIDAYYGDVVFFVAFLHKRKVSVMKPAHCRNESDFFVRSNAAPDFFPFFRCMYNFHFKLSCIFIEI